jgi:hypothetical protein
MLGTPKAGMSGKRAAPSGPHQWCDQNSLSLHFLSFHLHSFHDDIHRPLSAINEIRIRLLSFLYSKFTQHASDPSHHLAALSHDNTDSNCDSPILPPAIALSLPVCPKTSFICGPKSSMPKVEDVSI